ncbi:MAG: hypothetical protein JRE45_18695 [Deltaproteobacteria bacterium]|nr:hypothetical protein [Deltaproteobacteria bacterium]MBW2629626.1 hypothetical protein [Deltaproteobacteria bacterium]MBW2688149.1 hypothetical protein [Deltaproteobacteria bacterium]
MEDRLIAGVRCSSVLANLSDYLDADLDAATIAPEAVDVDALSRMLSQIYQLGAHS